MCVGESPSLSTWPLLLLRSPVEFEEEEVV
jgi:hypothetical protein